MNRLFFLTLGGVKGGLCLAFLLIASIANARTERVVIQGDHGFGPHPEEAVKLAVAFFVKQLK